jgi:hypothetical protein
MELTPWKSTRSFSKRDCTKMTMHTRTASLELDEFVSPWSDGYVEDWISIVNLFELSGGVYEGHNETEIQN